LREGGAENLYQRHFSLPPVSLPLQLKISFPIFWPLVLPLSVERCFEAAACVLHSAEKHVEETFNAGIPYEKKEEKKTETKARLELGQDNNWTLSLK